jgi:predicted nucleotidyltransferase
MPVRSLNSPVFKWPDLETVQRAVQAWAMEVAREHADILRIGYFGSYARGDWGFASDLDLIVVMQRCDLPFWQRPREFDTTTLPVPADLLVYSQAEWDDLARQGEYFYRKVSAEVRWIYPPSISPLLVKMEG